MAAGWCAWLAAAWIVQYVVLAGAGTVGVNYGRVANNLPSAEEVVQLVREQGIRKVKLYDADPAILAAFAHSGVDVTVALPNELLAQVARSPPLAARWVAVNVARHLPATSVAAVAVGNEVLSSNRSDWAAALLPAMKNVQAALAKRGLGGRIKVSSPHSLVVLSSSFPPSAGAFAAPGVMKPILDFLSETGSYVMVNAYPFFAYSSQPGVIPLSYALFEEGSSPVVDPRTGLKYTNLFDAQLDAFFSAMAALGQPRLGITVTETGWPSKGDAGETGAGPRNAAAYVANLVRHVTSGAGTPLRPGASIDTYIFALFNEDMKPGPTSERNYGLFYPNKQSVYGLHLQSELAHSPSSAASSSPHSSVPAVGQVHHIHHHHNHHHHSHGASPSSPTTNTWCVADPSVSPASLQAALDYACGPGKADCSLIQPGQACYNPDTLVAHASFAFNSYFQLNRKTSGSCVFGGVARVTSQNPSYTGCEYPGN